MNVHVARSVDEACALLADNPEAQVLAGGTDFMVEVNYRHRSPSAVVAINRVPETSGWSVERNQVEWNGGRGDATAETIRLGATLTFAEMEDPAFVNLLPALSQAARTVGSPQIRNAGTLGGNLGTASPAGDSLPVLAALDSKVILRSAETSRQVELSDFIVGPKQTTLQPTEIIEAVLVPKVAGHSEFLKVGTRNAMVISVAGLALFARTDIARVCVGLGSVAAVPVRAVAAEDWISPRLDWENMSAPTQTELDTFASLVAQATSPIDDHRGTADYRRHAVGVMAKRALQRAFSGSVPSAH